jgi:hypothetical protein
MLAHLIHYERRGKWVFILPLLIAGLLFIVFDNLGIDTQYIRTSTFFLSAAILYYIGYERQIIIEGVSEKSHRKPTKKDTFMWVHIRFWAMILALIGFISLWFDLA